MRVLCVVLALIVTMVAILAGQVVTMVPSSTTPKVAYIRERPDLEIVVIKNTLPASARLCAERTDSGLVSCRTVGEFRTWATQR